MKMKFLTLEEHRARIANVKSAELGNKTYIRKHRIGEYLPAQAVYHLGDYPAPFSIEPTEYDYNMIKGMAENGVQLIQLHEEWNDHIRRFGADKYTSHDPEGLDKFIELCHSFGIKVIPYISSGFLHEFDPDFKEEFTIRKLYCRTGTHFQYRVCSASSEEWRSFILPKTFAVLDRHDFDGIYNDYGTDSSFFHGGKYIKRDDVAGGGYDPELEDLLATIYGEVKKRGGIYKLHINYNSPAPCIEKVYDYLWIGEGESTDNLCIGKNYPPYVVPCPDKVHSKIDDPDYFFAAVIPFMQFPLLTSCGRPLRGRVIDEDVPLYCNPGKEPGFGYIFQKNVHEYNKEHPDGPHVHSRWSAIPDDLRDYPTWCKYMALYKPMVEENTIAYIGLTESEDILSPAKENVNVSMFVSHEKYLVVGNLSGEEYEIVLKEQWTDRETGVTSDRFTVKNNRLLFLKK